MAGNTNKKAKKNSAIKSAADGTNIFISWSGDTSRAVAQALFEWLRQLMDEARPWMSKESIRSGLDWFSSLKENLQSLEVAIVCITKDNMNAPWLVFEAGAFAGKVSDTARVMAYYVDLEPHEVKGPLAKYQARLSNKDDTWELVKDVNDLIGTATEENLKKRFEAFWEEFEGKLKAAPKPKNTPQPRKVDDMVVEVLDTLRAIQQDLASRPAPPRPLSYIREDGTIIQGIIPDTGPDAGPPGSVGRRLFGEGAGTVRALLARRKKEEDALVKAIVDNLPPPEEMERHRLVAERVRARIAEEVAMAKKDDED